VPVTWTERLLALVLFPFCVLVCVVDCILWINGTAVRTLEPWLTPCCRQLMRSDHPLCTLVYTATLRLVLMAVCIRRRGYAWAASVLVGTASVVRRARKGLVTWGTPYVRGARKKLLTWAWQLQASISTSGELPMIP
jgi:hypothetical protein